MKGSLNYGEVGVYRKDTRRFGAYKVLSPSSLYGRYLMLDYCLHIPSYGVVVVINASHLAN